MSACILAKRNRNRVRRLSEITPNMKRAKEALDRASLAKGEGGDFYEPNGSRHLYSVVHAVARRGLAVIDGEQVRRS